MNEEELTKLAIENPEEFEKIATEVTLGKIAARAFVDEIEKVGQAIEAEAGTGEVKVEETVKKVEEAATTAEKAVDASIAKVVEAITGAVGAAPPAKAQEVAKKVEGKINLMETVHKELLGTGKTE